MLSFLKEVRSELEKVTFPTRKEAMRLTGIVIVISVFVGLFIGFSDLLLTKILEIVIK
ncbi:MAG: preprotein translocase subunit SecE [Candidatus Levybacteria bacterium RIFCSPHIGHO2_01_FULL_36_15]|nr:MAG: preprotein translocase subunit SecE [Candidatus Levybacteria bacterium RIFCSPHIGHO2_01_FULL_36_15]OGH38023.1 MAG: preprotein translocase subunit SecE [Candidatus Levybacteria bacterium RIFCSPLOWO2_01_FULL_36_10]